MKLRHAAAAVAIIGLAGCGSSADSGAAAPQASSTASSTTVTTSSTTPATSSTTKVTPTKDQPTIEVCRAAANELDRNDLGSDLDTAIATNSLSPIAFATQVDKFRAIDAGSAIPAVGSAVNDFNDLTADLADSAFTLWTADQVQDWVAAYSELVDACDSAGSAI